MKLRLIYILSAFLILICNSVQASDLDVFMTVNRFYQIEEKASYVEISYLVPAAAVNFIQNEDRTYQAKLKVAFKLSNKNSFLNSKTYILQTDKYASLESINKNLTDLIRLNVPEDDTLSLEVSIKDINDSTSFESKVDVYVPVHKSASLSDIMLVNNIEENVSKGSFSRNNMMVVPKFLNYYPTEIEEIKFYCEFYQDELNDNFLVSYLLTNEEGVYVDGYAAHKKIVDKRYETIISGFNINKLPSGNYYLFMELKDSKNNIIERKRTFFQRNNKSSNTVENINENKNELDVITNNFAKKYDLRNIRHHLQALDPIADSWESATIESFKNSEDLIQMQNYFFSFWKQKNPNSPEEGWKAYAQKLQFVESNYTNLSSRGYETDMGRTYLRYGEPLSKQLFRKNGLGEFWVWNYERIDDQGNVFFVFQNRSNLTDDFAIVHTSLRGVIYDKTWAEYLKIEF